jgi:nicotinamide-nucleotide amidase
MGLAGPLDSEVVVLALSGSRWEIRVAAVHAAKGGSRATVICAVREPTRRRAALP